MVSKKEIRSRIRYFYDGEVSKECLEYLKSECEKLNDNYIKAGISEFHEINETRERIGLPIKKRIQVSTYKNLNMKLFKRPSDLFNSNIGQNNRDTMLSEAKEAI